MIEDALKQYLAQQGWYLEGIRQTQASLEQGRGIAHEAVLEEMEGLIEAQERTVKPREAEEVPRGGTVGV